MAFDFYATCNALAARYAPGTISTPTGEAAMRFALGQSPNDLSATPCVIVSPQDGELVYAAGSKSGEYRVNVNFYLAKASADFKRLETSRQRWLPVLLAATDGQMQLGQGGSATVQKAIPLTWEFTELPYGGESYDGITIHVTIYTLEPVSLTP